MRTHCNEHKPCPLRPISKSPTSSSRLDVSWQRGRGANLLASCVQSETRIGAADGLCIADCRGNRLTVARAHRVVVAMNFQRLECLFPELPFGTGNDEGCAGNHPAPNPPSGLRSIRLRGRQMYPWLSQERPRFLGRGPHPPGSQNDLLDSANQLNLFEL